MQEDFSKSKTPEQNIKVSIDKILGKDTTIKRKRRSKEDLKRETFEQFMEIMTYLDFRNRDLNKAYRMNMDEYDEAFMDAIDLLLKLTFNNNQLDIIYFYLYERIDLQGNTLTLKDVEGTIIPTNNAAEVWAAVQDL